MSFKKHELSCCHRESVEMILSLPRSTKHIGEHLSQAFSQEMEQNGKMLLKIISSIRYLARQGLALRGKGINECDGNFIQYLKSLESGDVSEWLQKKSNKYTSYNIQNELLKITALHVLRKNCYRSAIVTIFNHHD